MQDCAAVVVVDTVHTIQVQQRIKASPSVRDACKQQARRLRYPESVLKLVRAACAPVNPHSVAPWKSTIRVPKICLLLEERTALRLGAGHW